MVEKHAYHTGLEDVTAHTLCHSFVKKLVNANMLLDQVAALLGHGSLEATCLYTQPSECTPEKAVWKASGEIVK